MSEQSDWRDKTLALAGVFQAAAVVDRLAKTGYVAQPEFRTAVESLLEQNPRSTEAAFGSQSSLRLGLQVLTDVLGSNRQPSNQQALRYALGVFHIQHKLMKSPDTLNVIGSRLRQVRQQAAHFDNPVHENVVANLADLYVDTISKFRFRIHVQGDATYLQQDRVAAQIRTLLFAAVRAAILWRQVGGRRWHFLIHRKRYLATAQALLDDIKTLH